MSLILEAINELDHSNIFEDAQARQRFYQL